MQVPAIVFWNTGLILNIDDNYAYSIFPFYQGEDSIAAPKPSLLFLLQLAYSGTGGEKKVEGTFLLGRLKMHHQVVGYFHAVSSSTSSSTILNPKAEHQPIAYCRIMFLSGTSSISPTAKGTRITIPYTHLRLPKNDLSLHTLAVEAQNPAAIPPINQLCSDGSSFGARTHRTNRIQDLMTSRVGNFDCDRSQCNGRAARLRSEEVMSAETFTREITVLEM